MKNIRDAITQFEQLKQEISEYLGDQKQIIQNDKAQAIEALKAHVMDYAYSISTKILGEEVSMEGLSPEIVNKAICETER